MKQPNWIAALANRGSKGLIDLIKGCGALAAAFFPMGALLPYQEVVHGQPEETPPETRDNLQRLIEASKRRSEENKCTILRQQGKPCSLDSSGNVNPDMISEDVI